MSGELAKGFLDHFVANIDDDTPRLVYADYLDENGQPERAEFIRIQVERFRRPAWDASQVGLRVREQKLLDEHGEKWLAELPVVEGAKWEGFRRGIVAEVSFASYEAMRQNAHACRAIAPVEAVKVRWPRRREPRENPPPIAELREITLTGRPDDESEVGRLADSPQLATLRTLTAGGLWAEAFTRLMASPHLAGLKALRLPSNNLGNAGVASLVRAASLAALEELDISGRGVTERYQDDPVVQSPGMEALANWSGLAGLRGLTLNGNDFGQVGLRALLRSPHVAGLKRLSMRGTRIDGQAVAEFDSANKGLRLEALDLGENLLRDVGAEYVASVACLGELKSLHLDRCQITQRGAALFARKAKFLGDLRRLDVSFNQFRLVGLAALLDRQPAALHTLLLRDADLFDAGAELLASSPASNPLCELDLSRNGLTTAAVLALCDTEHLANLVVLRIADNPLGEPGAAALAGSAIAKRLSALETGYLPAPPPPYGGDIPF
jgi:uncharacterized protein (TIGR02996 family)